MRCLLANELFHQGIEEGLLAGVLVTGYPWLLSSKLCL